MRVVPPVPQRDAVRDRLRVRIEIFFEAMIQSIGGHPMATKASCTLFLIIEKKHAPWGYMELVPHLPWRNL